MRIYECLRNVLIIYTVLLAKAVVRFNRHSDVLFENMLFFIDMVQYFRRFGVKFQMNNKF